ncbi:dTDP-4-dehydrorhamnose reductase [Thermosulfurimonas marina]|uniref:dTDP-4-dehydrorhamnose reductase n=1 Tax=Thermosulfurimonas marina TaxID=2047767 RepID=A0A6H1WRU1_9BACT|nr:dTDP-4-dehydrorhamnose reductase [Thermosulfurimonas marina]QJA05888.1 dTDP-4-dehydrorhamnose reductase [Thermosulfurimonas marina]
MKVVVIGASGQLGQDIVNAKPGLVKLVGLTHSDIEITDKDSVFSVLTSLEPDVIINTAAFHKTDLCEDEPEKAFFINAVGVKNLVEVCKSMDSILVHISTDYVFDGAKITEKEPYTEEDLPNPINIYGISKYAGELIVKNYLDKYYIVRVASLYGKAGASGKGGNFVYTILKKAKAGEPLRVVDDIFMSPTYTLDAAREIWKLILEERPFGTYHVTNLGYCSWYEFAKKILEYAGVDASIEPVKHTEFKTKAKRPLWSPLKSVKGIELRPWEEALKEFIGGVSTQLWKL